MCIYDVPVIFTDHSSCNGWPYRISYAKCIAENLRSIYINNHATFSVLACVGMLCSGHVDSLVCPFPRVTTLCWLARV